MNKLFYKNLKFQFLFICSFADFVACSLDLTPKFSIVYFSMFLLLIFENFHPINKFFEIASNSNLFT